MSPRVAILLGASLLYAAACTGAPGPADPNLDRPGPVALGCVCDGAAHPIVECADDGVCGEAGLLVYLLERFRSTLLVSAVVDPVLPKAKTFQPFDMNVFVPGRTGLALPGQVLDVVAAPSGASLLALSAPRGLVRVGLPDHEVERFELPVEPARFAVVARACEDLDACNGALTEDVVVVIDATGLAPVLWRLDAEGAPAGEATLLPAPPVPLADVDVSGARIVGVARDGRSLQLLEAGTWRTVALEPECSDGLDNDGDGAIDGTDPSCTSADDTSEASADPADAASCGNGTDDDGDGLTDLDDPGCLRESDPREDSELGPCDDGVDNDGDGTTDGDPDLCAGDAPAFETDPCADGLDNDGDGAADGDDAACANGAPELPFRPACANGIDDDGDGLVDAPADPSCAEALATTEARPACGNGMDDDGDGVADGDDPDCYGAMDDDEQGPPGAGAARVVVHPDGHTAYALRAVQRDIVAVDLETGEERRCHAGDPSWTERRIVESPLPSLPLDMVFARSDALFAEQDLCGGEVERTWRAFVVTVDGLLSIYDPAENRYAQRAPLIREDDGSLVIDDDAEDTRYQASVTRPTLARAGDSVDIRFQLPRGVPHLGALEIEEDDRMYAGIELKADDAAIPSETWTLTSAGVLPGTDRRTGRIVGGGVFHDPGASFCEAGVETGDVLEILPPAPISCGGLSGEAFRVTVSEVSSEGLVFDPDTLTVREPDAEDGAFAAPESEDVSLDLRCLPGPLRYQVRTPPDIFLVEGSRSGVLHPWGDGPDGCVRTTEEPTWNARARVGVAHRETAADGALLPCPLTHGDDTIDIDTFPFENPIFSLTLLPGCTVSAFDTTYEEPVDDVVYSFTVSGGIRPVPLISGRRAGGVTAAPDGPVVYVDEGQGVVAIIDPDTVTSLKEIR